MLALASTPVETTEAVRLAEYVGARPLLFVGGLVALVIVGFLLATGAAVLTARHARQMWRWTADRWNELSQTAAVRALADRFPRASRAMRWLSAVEYVVVHVMLGAVVVACVLAFLALADAVTEHEVMVQVDLALAAALHASAPPGMIAVLHRFTDLGDFGGLTVATAIGVVALFVARRRVLAVGWALAMIGCALLNLGLKAWFLRARPSFPDPFVVAGGWSFPSGHAMGTFVLTGMATFVAFHYVRAGAWRIVLAVIATVWTVMMGYSRMALGAHYLTDVLAGFAAGAAWLSICVSALVVAESRARTVASVSEDPVPPPA